MANIKITELNELKQIATDDVLPIVDISANETKKVSLKNVLNVELIAVTDTAPLQCSVGDKYYNTTTNKIYTAIATDTWGTTGVDAVQGVFYVVFSEQSSYSYDGTTLVSVGGGTEDIIISDTEPTEEGVKIWIDTGEISQQASEITNSYSESTGIGYSANYVNNLVQDIYALDEEVKTNKVYKNGNTIKPIYRKIVSYGALPANQASSPTVNHNIANIDMITYWYGYCISSSGVSYNFDHYPADNMVSNMSIASRVTKEWVQVKVNSDMTSYNGYFVLEYTKTTD